MANLKTIPYTYLIGWTNLNKWYYGVRYATGCSPQDLFNPYQTSSKKVFQIIKEYGLPEIIEIRKVFNNVEKARLWESKVLKKLNVLNSDKWLNQTTNIGISKEIAFNSKDYIWVNNDKKEKYIFKDDIIPSGWKKGRIKGKKRTTRPCYEETKLKISIANKNKLKPPGFGEKISKARKGKSLSLETIEKIKISRRKQYITPSAKKWVFKYNNKKIEIFNLLKYCKENNLIYACMQDVNTGKQKNHKGYSKG